MNDLKKQNLIVELILLVTLSLTTLFKNFNSYAHNNYYQSAFQIHEVTDAFRTKTDKLLFQLCCMNCSSIEIHSIVCIEVASTWKIAPISRFYITITKSLSSWFTFGNSLNWSSSARTFIRIWFPKNICWREKIIGFSLLL